MTPDIELDIDELVLHGFAPGDRAGIAGAVQSELTRLFAEHGVPARLNTSSMIPHLDGGSSAGKCPNSRDGIPCVQSLLCTGTTP